MSSGARRFGNRRTGRSCQSPSAILSRCHARFFPPVLRTNRSSGAREQFVPETCCRFRLPPRWLQTEKQHLPRMPMLKRNAACRSLPVSLPVLVSRSTMWSRPGSISVPTMIGSRSQRPMAKSSRPSVRPTPSFRSSASPAPSGVSRSRQSASAPQMAELPSLGHDATGVALRDRGGLPPRSSR